MGQSNLPLTRQTISFQGCSIQGILRDFEGFLGKNAFGNPISMAKAVGPHVARLHQLLVSERESFA